MPRSERDEKDFEGDPRRDLPLLNGLRTGKNVSQRALAVRVGTAPSQVNRRISELLEAGYIEIVDPAVRPFAYCLTSRGREYRQELLHRRFEAVVDSLQEMREHINQRLTEIHKKGLKRVVFYGAGEVMEVALPLAETAGLNVVGLVDDDPNKHGGRRGGMTVRPPGSIRDLGADAILITTFRHTSEISGRIDACLQSRIQVLKL